MRVAPDLIVSDWLDATHGKLFGDAPPTYVRAALEQLDQERQIEGRHWLDATMHDVDTIIAASAQMELALPKMTQRALARDRFAKFWRDVVAPHATTRKEATIHEKLQLARREARVGVLPNGKLLFQWDDKAGLPLYDPDDARQEAMRLSRRMVPKIMELLERPGHRAYYLCGTAPNSPRGELAKGMRALYRRWYSLVRACKRKDRPFPIVGAVAVMESPLGRFGDWHPHLNIIVVCDGWLDFKALRERWHWNMEMRPLDGHRSTLERAFREIIKYSCRTVSEKSLAKQTSDHPGRDQDRVCGAVARSAADRDARRSDGASTDAISAGEGAGPRSRVARALECAEREAPNSQTGKAPAMEEWSPVEVLEFHRAHARFRRSRAYQRLFGVPKPEPLDRSGVEWAGRLSRDARGYSASFALLESIPGDKSTTENIRKAIREAWSKLLGPPDQLERARRARDMMENAYSTVQIAMS